MVKKELEGHAGRQPDGSAKTREAKLGCVFIQRGVDDEGWPLRDPDSTSYVASLETSRDFGAILRKEAFRRGRQKAKELVFMGDGAGWVWELARVNFPQAVHILDFYRAAEHLGELCDALYGQASDKSDSQCSTWRNRLKKDGIDEVIATAPVTFPSRTRRCVSLFAIAMLTCVMHFSRLRASLCHRSRTCG